MTKIFQICWNGRTLAQLEPGFTILDWRRNPQPHLREFSALLALQAAGEPQKNNLTGAVSPKFAAKAAISGAEFMGWIDSNPGYDFYFVHPRPNSPVFFFNGWAHSAHQFGSRFLSSAREIVELAGYDFDAWLHQREDPSNCFSMNFWAGNSEVWNRCMRVVEDILSVDPLKFRPETRSFFFSLANWRAPNQLPMAQIALVLERSVTSSIIADKSFSKLMYPASRERIRRCCRNPAEWTLYQSFAPIAERFDANNLAQSEEARAYFEMAGKAVTSVFNLYANVFGHPQGDDDDLPATDRPKRDATLFVEAKQ